MRQRSRIESVTVLSFSYSEQQIALVSVHIVVVKHDLKDPIILHEERTFTDD